MYIYLKSSATLLFSFEFKARTIKKVSHSIWNQVVDLVCFI